MDRPVVDVNQTHNSEEHQIKERSQSCFNLDNMELKVVESDAEKNLQLENLKFQLEMNDKDLNRLRSKVSSQQMKMEKLSEKYKELLSERNEIPVMLVGIFDAFKAAMSKSETVSSLCESAERDLSEHNQKSDVIRVKLDRMKEMLTSSVNGGSKREHHERMIQVRKLFNLHDEDVNSVSRAKKEIFKIMDEMKNNFNLCAEKREKTVHELAEQKVLLGEVCRNLEAAEAYRSALADEPIRSSAAMQWEAEFLEEQEIFQKTMNDIQVEYENEMNKTDAINDCLTDTETEYVETNEKLKSLHDSHIDLCDNLQTVEDEITALQTDEINRHHEISQLELKLINKKNENENAMQLLDKTTAQLSAIGVYLNTLKHDFSLKAEEISGSKININQIQSELHDVMKNLISTETFYTEMAETVKISAMKLSQLKDCKECELLEAEKKIEEKKNQLSIAEEENHKVVSHLRKMKELFAEKRAVLSSLITKLETSGESTVDLKNKALESEVYGKRELDNLLSSISDEQVRQKLNDEKIAHLNREAASIDNDITSLVNNGNICKAKIDETGTAMCEIRIHIEQEESHKQKLRADLDALVLESENVQTEDVKASLASNIANVEKLNEKLKGKLTAEQSSEVVKELEIKLEEVQSDYTAMIETANLKMNDLMASAVDIDVINNLKLREESLKAEQNQLNIEASILKGRLTNVEDLMNNAKKALLEAEFTLQSIGGNSGLQKRNISYGRGKEYQVSSTSNASQGTQNAVFPDPDFEE